MPIIPIIGGNLNLKSIAAVAALAVGLGLGATACGTSGYNAAYVTSRIQCPNNPTADCAVMSDGDVIQVTPSVWDTLLYGMTISQRGNSYVFLRSSSYHRGYAPLVSSSRYRSVKAVSVSSELSNEKTGNTYKSGGSSYKSSPVYKSNQAASARAVKAARNASLHGTTYKAPSKSYSYHPSRH
jgi:hypothetical protein